MPEPAASPTTASRENSYVDWGCALAGAAVAAAISFVLFTFGAGIGLTMISPWPQSSASGTTVLIMTTAWAVFVNIVAFAAGGYIAGRMRRPWPDATHDEIEFRDGAHGALVWAIGIVIGAMLLASASSAAVRAGAQGAGSAASMMAHSAQSQAGGTAPGQGTDWTSVAVDSLFRNSTQPPPNQPAADPNQARGEAARILARSAARGELADADRTYLTRLVAQRAGIPEVDAQNRVNQIVNEARQTADTARKSGILAAFLAAATLMVAAAVSWSSAVLGGQHRQSGTIWRGLAGNVR